MLLAAETQKKTELTLINVILCVLVVYDHTAANPVETLNPQSWQFATVFVPWRMAKIGTVGFLFLSGLKLFLSKKPFSYGRFWRVRATRIILPYLVWVIIYYLYFVREGYYTFNMPQLLRGLWLGDMAAQFYFIPLLMQFSLLIPFWRWWIPKARPALALPVCLLLTVIFSENMPEIFSILGAEQYFAYNDRLFTSYLIFWVAGCFAGYWYDDFSALLRGCFKRITVGFVLSAALDCSVSWLHYSGLQTLHWGLLTLLLYRLMAVLFLAALCLRAADRRASRGKLLKRMDEAGYLVYLVHVLAIYIINSQMLRLNITDVALTFHIRLIFTLAVSFALCIGWKQAIGAMRGLLKR